MEEEHFTRGEEGVKHNHCIDLSYEPEVPHQSGTQEQDSWVSLRYLCAVNMMAMLKTVTVKPPLSCSRKDSLLNKHTVPYKTCCKYFVLYQEAFFSVQYISF